MIALCTQNPPRGRVWTCRYLVPIPRVESLAELNALLEAADRSDDARHIAGRRASWGSVTTLQLTQALVPIHASAVGTRRYTRAVGNEVAQGGAAPSLAAAEEPTEDAAVAAPAGRSGVEPG